MASTRHLIAMALLVCLFVATKSGAYAQVAPTNSQWVALTPNRSECTALLGLERFYNSQTGSATGPANDLFAYEKVVGWLQGFFTALNMFAPATHGDITRVDMAYFMPWVFSYCRTHPTAILHEVALALANAIISDRSDRQ